MTYVKQTWVDNNPDYPASAARMNYIEDGIAAAVPQTGAAVAAGTVFSNYLLAADANPAFTVVGSGKLQWGPGGGTALDTNLYRSGAGTLFTDSIFQSALGVSSRGGTGLQYTPATATGNSLTSQVQGAAQPLLQIDVSGKINWGAGGASAVDTNLYRSAAGALNTDGKFVVGIGGAGELVYLPGGATEISINRWGPSSESAIRFGGDTSIYRPSAGVLKTASQISATDGVTTRVVAGAVSDGSFTVTPASGTLAVDTTNSKLYVRVGSTWKSVTVA